MKQLLSLYIFILMLACTGTTRIELFPADYQNGTFAFIENYPLAMALKLAGDGSSMAEKVPVPVIEVPEELKLIKVATRSGKMTEIPFSTENVLRNGKHFKRHHVMIPGRFLKNLAPEKFGWRADRGNQELISGPRARHIEQVTLGLIDVVHTGDESCFLQALRRGNDITIARDDRHRSIFQTFCLKHRANANQRASLDQRVAERGGTLSRASNAHARTQPMTQTSKSNSDCI